MSYSDYTLPRMREELGLKVRDERLFEPEPRIAPAGWLLDLLAKGSKLPMGSEKARSEFIVAPILLQCREQLNHAVQIFSGFNLSPDPERGLNGECDFILCRAPTIQFVQAPILVVLEAKKQDIDIGLGQCAAQVYAARLFNQRDGQKIEPLHGCVTTGEAWQFFRLLAEELILDTKRYYITELDSILGILTTVLQASITVPLTDAAT